VKPSALWYTERPHTIYTNIDGKCQLARDVLPQRHTHNHRVVRKAPSNSQPMRVKPLDNDRSREGAERQEKLQTIEKWRSCWWCTALLLTASRNLRQNVLCGRIWGTGHVSGYSTATHTGFRQRYVAASHAADGRTTDWIVVW
jgi:hypothetical protein